MKTRHFLISLLLLTVLLLAGCTTTPPLQRAIVARDTKKIEKLTSKPKHREKRDVNGATPLHCAAETGQLEVTKKLVQSGVKIDPRMNDQSTPLILACKAGHCSVVRYLHEQGADLGATTKSGSDGLFNAAFAGRLHVVKYALSNAIDPNRATVDHWTPLHAAAENGHLQVVLTLLQHGANPSAESKVGFTPYDCAVFGQHPDVSYALLDAGAKPHPFSKEGFSDASWKTAVTHATAAERCETKGEWNLAWTYYAVAATNYADAAVAFKAIASKTAGKLLLAFGADVLVHTLAAAGGVTTVSNGSIYSDILRQGKNAREMAKKAAALSAHCRQKIESLQSRQSSPPQGLLGASR
jgi:ankyrin repeat protein